MSPEIAVLIVVVVLVVALFVISYMRKKKFNGELGTMREELKVGDKVMTDTGVVGEVVESFTEDEYTYFVLKTGRGSNVGYFTVHANAIYYSFEKEKEKQEQSKIVVKTKSENLSVESSDNKVEEIERAVSAKKTNTTTKSGNKKTSTNSTKSKKS